VGVLFGSPETTSGGAALKYYASMRLDIRAKEKIMETGKPEPVGNRVKVKVVKNKVGPGRGAGRARRHLEVYWLLMSVSMDMAVQNDACPRQQGVAGGEPWTVREPWWQRVSIWK
jgi:hypothetical protein